MLRVTELRQHQGCLFCLADATWTIPTRSTVPSLPHSPLPLTVYLATYDPDYNAFNYFGSWLTQWQAMYIFGVCIGALAWLVALVAGVVDMRLTRRHVSG